MADKTITVRISKDLHKKLKIQLAKDSLTFQKWASDRIKEYTEEKAEVNS